MAAELVDCTFEEYIEIDAISRSMHETFLERDGEELYHAKYIAGTVPDKSSKAKDFGAIFHDLILGTNQMNVLVVPSDVLASDGSRRGKKWDNYAEEHADYTLVTPKEKAQLDAMRAKCMEHPFVSKALEHKDRLVEMAIVWDHESGMRLKCRPDLMVPGRAMLDIKTYTPSVIQTFSRHVYDFGYHRQAAWYLAGHEALFSSRPPFGFVAVRKDPPYTVRVYEMHQSWLDLGEKDMRYGLDRLKACYDENRWKPHGWDQIQYIEPPPWAIPKEDV